MRTNPYRFTRTSIPAGAAPRQEYGEGGNSIMQPLRIHTRHERGSSGLKTLVALALLGIAVYAGLQILTVYDAYWTFEKDVETLVRFAFVNLQGNRQQQIVDHIAEMLDSLNVQYTKHDIRVTVDDVRKQITVDVSYAQTINVPFYPNPKVFHTHVQHTDTIG
jgi:hypothetical protein